MTVERGSGRVGHRIVLDRALGEDRRHQRHAAVRGCSGAFEQARLAGYDGRREAPAADRLALGDPKIARSRRDAR